MYEKFTLFVKKAKFSIENLWIIDGKKGILYKKLTLLMEIFEFPIKSLDNWWK